MRAMNLSDALIAAGHKVVLWSSAFYHQEKRHRCRLKDRVTVSPHLEIRLIPSPGYRQHVGFGRLLDHAILARNLSNLLADESDPPDVAFVGYPPIETAAVMTRWLNTRGVPTILDVKDKWPDIFLEVLPRPFRGLGRLVLAPYFYFALRAFRDATALSAMANGFLQWAANFAGREVSQLDRVVPLTASKGKVSATEFEKASVWWDQQGVKADGTQRIIFVGSHSPAFDIDPVCEAAIEMERSGTNCQFVICGDGTDSLTWRRKMGGLSNVIFPGWIEREKVEVLAMRSSATLAPYHNSKDFVMSIPNKVIDSLALGLPVLSPLSGEVESLISDSEIGMSYGRSTGKSLSQCIEDLMNTPGLRDRLSVNALHLFETRFSFDRVYGRLVEHLETLARR